MTELASKMFTLDGHVEKMIADAERLKVFSEVFAIYQGSRAIGHTTMMMKGVDHYANDEFLPRPIIVLGSDRQRSQDVFASEVGKVDFVSLSDLSYLRGIVAPIAWDNHAIIHLCSAGNLAYKNLIRLKQLREPE